MLDGIKDNALGLELTARKKDISRLPGRKSRVIDRSESEYPLNHFYLEELAIMYIKSKILNEF